MLSYPTPSRSAALLLALVLSSAAAAEPRYDVLNLRKLGLWDAYALNNHGHVVGAAPESRLLWNGKTVTQLPLSADPVITDLNDSGALIGYRSYPFDGDRGFVFADGASAEIEGARVPTAINNSGQITINGFGNPARAVIYHDGAATDVGTLGGTLTGLSDINTAGWAVGSSALALEDPRHAILFRDGTLTDLGTLGGDQSWASDINDQGAIVGAASADSGKFRAMLYTGGKMLQIGSYDAEGDYEARKINNYHVVLGQFANGPGLWSGGVVKPLAELVDLAGLGYNVIELIDLNDRGQLLIRGWEGPMDQERDPLLLTPRPLPSARLTALAARSIAGTNDQTSIAGFVVAGDSPGSILLRTVGPALAPLGVGNAATDPAITIFNSSGSVVATNDNWSDDESKIEALSSTATRLGAQPLAADSADAALLADLPAGAYTAHASNPADPSRIVLTEIYDAGDDDARLTAASIRLHIGTGESIGIVGFALAGEGPAKVLLRALGPDLATRGVANNLADPQLWLYRGSTPVLANDDWGSADTTPLLASTTTQVGLSALPDASKDAALLVQLEPGAYTLHVSGTNNSTGIALVEVYLVPDTAP